MIHQTLCRSPNCNFFSDLLRNCCQIKTASNRRNIRWCNAAVCFLFFTFSFFRSTDTIERYPKHCRTPAESLSEFKPPQPLTIWKLFINRTGSSGANSELRHWSAGFDRNCFVVTNWKSVEVSTDVYESSKTENSKSRLNPLPNDKERDFGFDLSVVYRKGSMRI